MLGGKALGGKELGRGAANDDAAVAALGAVSSEWERDSATTVTDGDGVCHQHST